MKSKAVMHRQKDKEPKCFTLNPYDWLPRGSTFEPVWPDEQSVVHRPFKKDLDRGERPQAERSC